jgi:hypothetical protein
MQHQLIGHDAAKSPVTFREIRTDAQVTQRYAHLSMKSLQEAANTASTMIERGQKTA